MLRRFLQMSGMIMGGCIGADAQMRQYEARMRARKRMGMDRAAWEQYESEFAEVRAREAQK